MGQTTAQYRTRGAETNVPPTQMSAANRAIWLRREQAKIKRLRAEFDADPDMQSQSSAGGEDWSQHDRRRGPKPASLQTRIAAALADRVGELVTSRKIAELAGVRYTSGTSHAIARLVQARVLVRQKCGFYIVSGRVAT